MLENKPKNSTYVPCERLCSYHLGEETTFFCFLSIFPVMLVDLKMVNKQAVFLLPRRNKNFEDKTFQGYRKCMAFFCGWWWGGRSIYLTFMSGH